MGVPPAGKQIELSVIDIFRIADGKIAEHWMQADILGMMQQLGMLPPPGPPR
jgi:predicted ester cyclase